MHQGFWKKLRRPILGLSPMDGVTDAAFRLMTHRHSTPSAIYTEFVNVEGLARGAVSMLDHFIYDESERPIVAQLYGIETESFYQVALMVCYLGFDGIDINMGCPANKVARRNSGAGLIRVPDQARKIIRTVKKATEDWANGITLEEAGLRPKVIKALKLQKPRRVSRKHLPVSVKTRTGIDKPIAEEWISHLLEESPAALALHGRTLKQMYTEQADWELIGKIADLVRPTGTVFLGNGDIQTLEDALNKIETYGTDGALIGRATTGNPWFFTGHEPTVKERFDAAIEHSRLFEEKQMKHAYFAMRKHLAWYCRGFDGAREIRKELMQADSTKDVERILGTAQKKPAF